MNNPNVSMPKLLTISEVSEMLRIPVPTLRFYRNRTIKHNDPTGPKSAKLGGQIRYRESDVIAWVESQFAGDSDE